MAARLQVLTPRRHFPVAIILDCPIIRSLLPSRVGQGNVCGFLSGAEDDGH
jgi:hypothetical protein